MEKVSTWVDDRHAVLLIDDDAAVRDALKFNLHIAGFQVRAYASARDLLNDDALPPSCCLVTDYNMPEMNGLELVAQLRDRRLCVPAILVTSANNENLRTRAAAAGIAIIEKPVLGNHLSDAITRVFADHRQRSTRC